MDTEIPKNISRRNLLKAAAVGAGVGALIDVALPQIKDVANTFENEVVIDKVIDNHEYRFIFWTHGYNSILTGSLDLELFTLPQTILESAYSYLDASEGDYFYGIDPSAPVDTQLVVRELENNHKLVYVDLSLSLGVGVVDQLTPLIEVVLGVVGTELAKKKLQEKPQKSTRRNVLKMVAGVSLLGIVHGLAGVGTSLSDLSTDQSIDLSKAKYTIEQTQPFNIIDHLRNLIAAYKIKDLGQDSNILYGKGHLALVTYMEQSEDELLAELTRLKLLFPYFKTAIGDERYLYTSSIWERKAEVNGQLGIQISFHLHSKLQALFSE